MNDVLFTGITGRLGIPLQGALRKRGISVACIIRRDAKEYACDLGGFKLLRADIASKESMAGIEGEIKGKVETTVHMATVGINSREEDMRKTIVEGSANVFRCAESSGCRNFLYLSSIAAAGWALPGEGPIDERSAIDKRRLGRFGRMKREAEERLLGMSGRSAMKTIVLRLGNVYGPPTKLSFVKPIWEMLKRRDRLYYNRIKNSCMWSPVYIDDVIDCILMLIERGLFSDGVYFLTGDENPRVEAIAGMMAAMISIRIEDMRLRRRDLAYFSLRKLPDLVRGCLRNPSFPDFAYSNERLKKVLGYIPKVGLEDGLKRTLKWAIEDRIFQKEA